MQPIETQAAVQRLLRFAEDPVRAARIARLARGVAASTGDDFFKYLSYAVDTHSDFAKVERDEMVLGPGRLHSSMLRERDSLISTAFAQAAPR